MTDIQMVMWAGIVMAVLGIISITISAVKGDEKTLGLWGWLILSIASLFVLLPLLPH